MTYEDLLVAIANEIPKLSGNGLKLLIRLIACAIESGTGRVTVSKYWLADKTQMSREGITIATREIAPIVPTEPARGVSTTFILPEDWFTPQRSLFAIDSRVQNRLQSPNFQATGSQETRRLVAQKPGDASQETWRQSPTNLASVAQKPGDVARKPGDASQETWRLNTQNQRLTGSGDSIESIEAVTGNQKCIRIVDVIARVDRVEKHQQQDAEILREQLVEYRLRFHQNELASKAPDDKIVARCLAIAPIEKLCETLNQMAADNIQPRPKNAWFVTLLLNKIHDVPPEITKARFQLHFQKKPASSEGDGQYSADLLQQVSAAARTM